MLRALVVILCCASLSAQAAPCAPPPGYDAFLQTIVTLTNEASQKKRRKPLAASTALNEAAQSQACYMANSGNFSHRGAGGSQVQDRVEKTGYSWRFVAENIALGQPIPQAAFQSWKKSPGHRRNMLHKRARDIGMGVALRDGRPYWVMVLGNKR